MAEPTIASTSLADRSRALREASSGAGEDGTTLRTLELGADFTLDVALTGRLGLSER